MPTISKELQRKTYEILDQFFKSTAHISVNNDLERDILLRRTDELFYVLKALGKDEFAKIFTLYNFTSSDVKINDKYQEVLTNLIAAIIKNYQQTDLLRYFFPENLSQKENKPQYSNSSSIISYCFQLISYWLRQIRNKPRYELKTEHSGLADSINQLKTSLNNETYLANRANDGFNQHLTILREKIQERAISPKRNEISRINSITHQEYEQRLIDKDKALHSFDNDLRRFAMDLNEREKEFEEKESNLRIREEQLISNESINEQVSVLLREEREALNNNLELLRGGRKKIVDEGTVLRKENSELKEQLAEKETQLAKQEKHICLLKKVGSNGGGAYASEFISFLEAELGEKEAQIRFLNASQNALSTSSKWSAYSGFGPMFTTSNQNNGSNDSKQSVIQSTESSASLIK